MGILFFLLIFIFYRFNLDIYLINLKFLMSCTYFRKSKGKPPFVFYFIQFFEFEHCCYKFNHFLGELLYRWVVSYFNSIGNTYALLLKLCLRLNRLLLFWGIYMFESPFQFWVQFGCNWDEIGWTQ